MVSPDGGALGTNDAATTPYPYATFVGDWNATTYRGSVEYDIRPQSMLYATYATGYQPGLINAMNPTGSPKLELEQITVGIKNRFFDNKLQVNVEAFDSSYHNRTLQGGIPAINIGTIVNQCGSNTGGNTTDIYRAFIDTAGNSCLSYTAAAVVPDLKSRGVDIEIGYLPTAADRIDLALEYLESNYKANPVLNNPMPSLATILTEASITAPTAAQSAAAQSLVDQFASQVNAFNGLVLQNSPEWSVNASYEHRFTFPGGSTLTPRLSAFYKSIYWTTGGGPAQNIWAVNQALQNGSFNAGIQKAYMLADAYLTWQNPSGKITVTGYMKNIENEAVIRNSSTTNITLADPRVFGLTLSADF